MCNYAFVSDNHRKNYDQNLTKVTEELADNNSLFIVLYYP